MTQTLLELAREAVRLRTVMDDCLAVEYRDASYKFHEAYRQFEMEATPGRILELCEAAEKAIECLGYEHREVKARLRRALNGE